MSERYWPRSISGGGVFRRESPVQHRQRVDPARKPRQSHGLAFRGRSCLQADQRGDQLQVVLHPVLKFAHQHVAIADLALELFDLRPFAAADIDQRGDPEVLDAVVVLDHRGIGLHDDETVDRRGRTEHADKILAVPDRLAQGLARVLLVEKAIETGPALALHIGRRHRHQILERLVDVDDVLLLAGTTRYRDGDRSMIQQMLVFVVLDRQRELRRTQKLVDPLGGRDVVVGAHMLTVFMTKP